MNGYLLEKVEDGFKTWLQTTAITGSVSGSTPVTVYKGMDNVDKIESNALIVFGESASQIEYGMNIYTATVVISYRYSPENEYETDIDVRNATYKNVTETLFKGDLKTNLINNSTDLAVYDCECVGTNNGFDGTAWQGTIVYEITCGINKH